MLFLKPDLRKIENSSFHRLFCQTCYSPPVTSYLTQVQTFRPTSNLEGFVWSHQSITGLISQRQFAPKCQFLASRPLGCCSFQNILTNLIILQINTLLLPYFISYYSSAVTTATPRCTLRSILCSLCFLLFSNNYFDLTVRALLECMLSKCGHRDLPALQPSRDELFRA